MFFYMLRNVIKKTAWLRQVINDKFLAMFKFAYNFEFPLEDWKRYTINHTVYKSHIYTDIYVIYPNSTYLFSEQYVCNI